MADGEADLMDEIYDGGKRLEATWTAVALLYGCPPCMLDANVPEIKQAMAKFRQTLVGQYPYVAEWTDRQLMSVHQMYTAWYIGERWGRAKCHILAKKS